VLLIALTQERGKKRRKKTGSNLDRSSEDKEKGGEAPKKKRGEKRAIAYRMVWHSEKERRKKRGKKAGEDRLSTGPSGWKKNYLRKKKRKKRKKSSRCIAYQSRRESGGNYPNPCERGGKSTAGRGEKKGGKEDPRVLLADDHREKRLKKKTRRSLTLLGKVAGRGEKERTSRSVAGESRGRASMSVQSYRKKGPTVGRKRKKGKSSPLSGIAGTRKKRGGDRQGCRFKSSLPAKEMSNEGKKEGKGGEKTTYELRGSAGEEKGERTKPDRK